MVLEDGEVIFESNAILVYFAEGTGLYADGRLERARILQWLFFEQFELGPNVALARFHCTIARDRDAREAEIGWLHERGYRALGTVEEHLRTRRYFAADRYTIADVALYPYTRLAAEGGFDLGRFPATRAWLDRVEQQPGYVPLIADAGNTAAREAVAGERAAAR